METFTIRAAKKTAQSGVFEVCVTFVSHLFAAGVRWVHGDLSGGERKHSIALYMNGNFLSMLNNALFVT